LILDFSFVKKKEHWKVVNELSEQSFVITLLNNSETGFILIDGAGKILYADQNLTDFLGLEEVKNSNLGEFSAEDLESILFQEKSETEKFKTEKSETDYRFKIKSGEGNLKEVKIKSAELDDNKYIINFSYLKNTDKVKYYFQKNHDYLKEIVSNISEIILLVNKAGFFVDIWSPDNEDLIIPAEDAVGMHISEVLPENLAEIMEEKIEAAFKSSEIQIFDYELKHKHKKKHFEARLIRVFDDDKIITVIKNITESVEKEKKIKYLSFHDELTGLYNRRYLNAEIKRLTKSRKLPISVVIGDLDKLKSVNDNYGHSYGDKYIKRAAEILKSTFRSEDIIARIGGDEFAVLLPETDRELSEEICDRIRINFEKSNRVENFPIPLSISLGTATMNSNDHELEKYYKDADQKMYKNKGRKF